ncbi:hypothetical protein JD844_005906 [Phrynosoma platyrhinos]|uniref:Cation channel sperm-associated protein subunit gamma n=1 Tax=Phrynosoma platyrhinos TaxID=52577 RepID=A0ABQ7TPA5_PHRPL|nr:hypothetical protein JD844_005906 [Phrynosoma platyrhinos]
MKPLVTVSFEEPANSVRQKQEQLEIEMTAAPFRMAGCDSEEACRMCWYTPMPFMNGSVVMDVTVTSNNIGLPVDNKRFSINVNGFTNLVQNKSVFKIGTKLTTLKSFLSLTDPSRPLWHTYLRAPVLILGDIPGNKIVLMSDTGFEDYFPVELGIDSCWIGSISCPQKGFSSSIVDTIATESTLFIRQNQLVYYFVGNYPLLHMQHSGSEMWTRLLNNVCVKKLNPVFFVKNDSEYVIALGGGWQEGEFFLITVKDGIVKSTGPLRARQQSVCQFLKVGCSIVWVAFSTNDNKFFLLVNEAGTNRHFIVEYQKDIYFKQIYEVPQFIPRASDTGFVLLLGKEAYMNRTLVPRGLALNPFNGQLGMAFGSSNREHTLSSAGPPQPDGAVLNSPPVWVMREGSLEIKRAYPSKAWSMYNTLQVMEGSQDHDLDARQAIVTVFFDKDGMQELIYREDPGTTGKLIKRKFPLDHVLAYDQLINTPHKWMTYKFTHRCPFAVVRLVDLPFPQRFTRMEHYRAKPPEIMEKTGFHNTKSLTVYQGLVYQLLQLHSAYHREYYYYMASNWKSSGGIYVDMANYVKIYNLMPNNLMPKTIYLDKKQTFVFSVYLSIRTTKQSSKLWEPGAAVMRKER